MKLLKKVFKVSFARKRYLVECRWNRKKLIELMRSSGYSEEYIDYHIDTLDLIYTAFVNNADYVNLFSGRYGYKNLDTTVEYWYYNETNLHSVMKKVDPELVHVEWLKNKYSFQFMKRYITSKIQLAKEGKEEMNYVGILHTIDNLSDEFLVTRMELDSRMSPEFKERLNLPLQ